MVLLRACNSGDRLCFLLRGGREDGGAVLRADVVALAVKLRRIVGGEADIQQIAVAHFFRIESDANRFCMTGCAAADLLIGRIRTRAAGIAAFNRLHADHIFKNRFGTPETAACDHCVFDCHNA